MEKRAIDVAQALVRLSELTIFELRGEWRRLHRMPPPMRLSRDLLIRGITYKLQRAYGGLSKAAVRKLEQAAAGPPSRGAVKPAPPISLRPGTRLVREWRGHPHGPHPCRWHCVARPALPFPLRGRAKDHGCPILMGGHIMSKGYPSDLAGALKSYNDSLAIADRLAKSDPGNAGWQRDLSLSYERVGNVQVGQGDLAGALKSYRDGLAVLLPGVRLPLPEDEVGAAVLVP